jgi:CheY-like chemotaxis protein
MIPTLLIIDDNTTVQRMIRLALTQEHVHVSVARRDRDVFEQIEESPPAIIFTEDASKLRPFLHARPTLSDIPVVLLRGAFDPTPPGDAAPTDHVLTKPLQPQAVIDCVRRLLAQSAARRETTAAPPKAAPVGAPLELEDYFDRLHAAFERSGSISSGTGDLPPAGVAYPARAAEPIRRFADQELRNRGASASQGVSEELVEQVTQRVLDRLGERIVRTTATEVVSRLSKWLIQNESNESTSGADHAAVEVSLAQLTGARVAIAWPEAVAIVQQVCESSAASIDSEFDPSLITLHASGAVSIDGPARADTLRAVQSLGELLRTCLAGTEHPVPLHLVIAQASSTPPFYRSVAELSEALAFFETTSRSECVRGVFARWRAGHQRQPDSRRIDVRALVGRLQQQGRSFAVSAGSRLLAIVRAGFARAQSRAAPHALGREAGVADAPVLATATVLFLCAGVAAWCLPAAWAEESCPLCRSARLAHNRTPACGTLIDGAVDAIRRRR